MRSYSLKWRLVMSLLVLFISLWSLVFVWLYVDLHQRLQETLDQRLSASAQMVSRLIEQLPIQTVDDFLLNNVQKTNDSDPLIACEVSLFGSDISVGQQVVATTRGAPQNLSQQHVGFSTWQQDGVEWRSYVLRKGEIQVVAAERLFLRDFLLQQILQSVLIPLILTLLICIAIIIFIIRKEFKTLDEISCYLSREDLSLREATQYLAELDPKQIPKEVQPFVDNSSRLIQRLHQSLENEKVFTAYAAHELRSPLTAIKTHVQLAQMIAQQQNQNEQLQNSLQQANTSIRRYAQLLEQLLALTHIDQDAAVIHETCDISTVLKQVIIDLNLIYPELEHKLYVEWLSLKRMDLPSFALHTVLKNLLENAALHAQANKISICMEQDILVIRDDGKKLNFNDLAMLNQRFWRKSSEQAGHGLGLSLVKNILEKYHYQLSFNLNTPYGFEIRFNKRE